MIFQEKVFPRSISFSLYLMVLAHAVWWENKGGFHVLQDGRAERATPNPGGSRPDCRDSHFLYGGRNASASTKRNQLP